MRHASWNAISALLPEAAEHHGAVLELNACDWLLNSLHENGRAGSFNLASASTLLAGGSTFLPDCPTCALFVDLALSIRAAAEQEKVNAAIDAERTEAA